MSRTLAIGDVHGCLRALQTMEDWLDFDPDDQLILLGDYVDRGPDTRGVLEWLIDRQQKLNLIALRGNHEVMMSGARTSEHVQRYWRRSGGTAALDSYAQASRIGTIDDVPEEHWNLLESELRPYYESSHHLFAHAGLLADVALEDQPDDVLYWVSALREEFPPHQSGKLLIVGHAAQHDGLPKSISGCVCIDTCAYGDGWLTCLDVDTGQYWQTNQLGQQRPGDHRLPTSVS